MQPLQDATTARALPQACARSLLGGVHVLMGFIRHEMRHNRRAGLSVPHFRALVLLSHTGDASVSAMAEHLGLSLPAASRLADVLVRRGLLARQSQVGDRRRVLLSLTSRGRAVFEEALAATEEALASKFETVPRRQLNQVIVAMQALDRVFSTPNGEPKR
jgi:DNA-binding MarR family transcriptional regulator